MRLQPGDIPPRRPAALAVAGPVLFTGLARFAGLVLFTSLARCAGLALFTGFTLAAGAAGAGDSATSQQPAPLRQPAPATKWRPLLSVGYDTYVHTYSLASTDTTETIAEASLAAEIEGRSPREATHAWRLRGEASAGTELFRESVDGGWKWQPSGETRIRGDLTWIGRQYRSDSEYSLSSNHQEGRGELRAYPWAGRRHSLDLRLLGRYLDYQTPSTLERDYREGGGGTFLSSRGLSSGSWRVGLRGLRRAYPDSAAIDRDVVSLEGDLDRTGEALEMWLYHRSDRRLAANEVARPSAWSHWTDLRFAVPAGTGYAVATLSSEVWRYDTPNSAYFDSWRHDVEFGYRWGDPLATQWHALLTVDRLDAGDSPETYNQVGVRTSVELYGGPFSGVAALEHGHRWYQEPDAMTSPSTVSDSPETAVTYSDFSYFEIWLMATWTISRHLSFDVMASYQPEEHTEQNDDIGLGYGSVRLVWRP